MDKYTVRVYARAYRDLDHIYAYIAEKLLAPDSALSLVSALEEAIYTLERLPERGAKRRAGMYAKTGYRQLFIKNYTIIYRVLKETKEVHIATIQYTPHS